MPVTSPPPRAPNIEATLQAVDKILQGADLPSRENTAAELHALVRAMAVTGTHRDDPMREICARIGDRWSNLLLLLLNTGKFRHSALRRLVSVVSYEKRISQRMLTLRLRTLERDGLISRHATATHPPGTEYALTDLGRGLLAQIGGIMDWIRAHDSEIREARQRFNAQEETPDHL